MASGNKTVIAFDLYGTLLSTESIAKELATHFGSEKAEFVAALWRRYQLEYTWRLNSMLLFRPFSDVTRLSLEHALAESSLILSDSDIEKLMQAYDSLSVFPDVPSALKSLSIDPSIDAYVFSNGTTSMVHTSVNSSPSLSPYSSVFKSLITVSSLEVYKPDPTVYQYLAKQVGKTLSVEDMESIWLVSGNPFDVVGARAAGIQAAWVDRAGGHHGKGGWNDRLGELTGGGPTIVVKSVEEAVEGIRRWVRENGGEKGSGAGYNREEAALGPG